MLRPICRCVIISSGSPPDGLEDMLMDIGAPVMATGDAGRLGEMLSRCSPALLIVDGTGSMVEVQAAALRLERVSDTLRPIVLVLVPQRRVGELPYSSAIDDFVMWPCPDGELERRIAIARWRRLGLTGEGILRSGELAIDLRQHRVIVAGREAVLTVREYELLRTLVQAQGAVMTRDALLSRVWGEDYLGGPRTVDIHIRRLRAKLPEIAERIVTVRGLGYRLGPPTSNQQPAPSPDDHKPP